jgi:hypothetical protein
VLRCHQCLNHSIIKIYASTKKKGKKSWICFFIIIAYVLFLRFCMQISFYKFYYLSTKKKKWISQIKRWHVSKESRSNLSISRMKTIINRSIFIWQLRISYRLYNLCYQYNQRLQTNYRYKFRLSYFMNLIFTLSFSLKLHLNYLMKCFFFCYEYDYKETAIETPLHLTLRGWPI